MNENPMTESKLIDQTKPLIFFEFEHDLRNLCAAMQSATDVIRLDTGISKDTCDKLAILDRQLLRLTKVVTGLNEHIDDRDITAAKHNRVDWDATNAEQNAFIG